MSDRGVSPVVARSGFTRAHGAIALGGVTALAVGAVLLHGATREPKKERQGEPLRVQAVQHYEPAPAPRVIPVAAAAPVVIPPPAPAPSPVAAPREREAEVDPMAKARHAPLLAYGGIGSAPAQQRQGEAGQVMAQAGRQTDLGQRLVPTQVSAVAASVLRNQPYLLTKGRSIPCELESAIDSTLPGAFTCRVPVDVESKYHVTLIDRGSVIYGETGGNMRQGERRLFALAARVETPNGVVADLNSAVTDSLGRTGMPATVENHTGERMLNTLLLSLVSGGMQEAAVLASAQGAGGLSTSGMSGVVSDAFAGSVNLRPTGHMNQGDLIAITLNRDVDFSGVYTMSIR